VSIYQVLAAGVQATCATGAFTGGGANHARVVDFGHKTTRPDCGILRGIASPSMRREQKRDEILSLTKAIERAWNAGDVKSYASLYARSARYVTRSGVPWKGRAAIRRGHAAAFRGALRGSKLKIRLQRVRFLSPQPAVVHCAIELTEKTGKRRRKVRAVTRFTMRKIRDRWEITSARTREAPPQVNPTLSCETPPRA
jgi:uncharacterized protein (TIGR02246 family)